ncbi:MAG: O-antigen ligase family protein [Bacteroidota bacterium]|nr:O-antigen ligase family protein [Bacteroidota bacterium]
MTLEGSKIDRWIFGIGGLFLILNTVFIATEFYLGLALPFIIAIAGLAVFRLDKLLLLAVMTTPISVTLNYENFNLGLSLPTEPIFAGITLLVILRFLQNGKVNFRVLKEPLSIIIILNICWFILTSMTSVLPLVSLKYTIVRIWFVIPLYFIMIQVLRERKNIEPFFWLYLIPLSLVCLYTMAVHSQYDFSKSTSTWVMFPFYKEHTSYGAALAMYVPVIVGLFMIKGRGVPYRVGAFVLGLILIMATILSYTRAAWVSLVAAFVVFILVHYRVRVLYVVMLALLGLGILWANWGSIEEKFQANTAVSSDDLSQHVASISNISTDASNTERINRWKSAMRMFEERPVFGWGPGTYMFRYAPFQKPWEKTIISTNAGNRGNAHSEYIGPLAETGVIGLLLVLAFVTGIAITGVRTYYRMPDRKMRIYVLVAFLGLVTYFTHGFLNNFLDMDKLAVPVFGFCAMIVSAKIYHAEERNP